VTTTRMDYVRLGKTGLQVSRVCLGSARKPDCISSTAQCRMKCRDVYAVDLGSGSAAKCALCRSVRISPNWSFSSSAMLSRSRT